MIKKDIVYLEKGKITNIDFTEFVVSDDGYGIRHIIKFYWKDREVVLSCFDFSTEINRGIHLFFTSHQSTRMKKIKLMEYVIQLTKEKAKPKDNNTAYIQTKKGLSVVLFAVEKYTQKLGLETFRLLDDNPEMVFVANVWASMGISKKDIKKGNHLKPSEDPKRKEAFAISYFSKNREATHYLFYQTLKNGKIKWLDEISYLDEKIKSTSGFNPYKFTKEQIKEWKERTETDIFKQKAKKETIKLLKGFKIFVYRKDKKIMFEVMNHKGKIFMGTKVSENNKDFENRLKIVSKALQGDIKEFEKFMKNKQK